MPEAAKTGSQLMPNGSVVHRAEFCECCVSIKSNMSRPARTAGELSPSVLCLFYAISCRSDLTAVKYVRVSLEPMQQKQKPAPELIGLCREARDYSSACLQNWLQLWTLMTTLWRKHTSNISEAKLLGIYHSVAQVRIQKSFLTLEKNPQRCLTGIYLADRMCNRKSSIIRLGLLNWRLLRFQQGGFPRIP